MSARGLFRREGRSISAVAEGHKLLGYADRLLRLADEAVSEMRTGKPQGECSGWARWKARAGSRLAPILSRYHTMLPRGGRGAGDGDDRRADEARA